ncbi:MAG: sugar ABC transporter permease, partial [Lachnospiraceae bacterium]|nr:sugar ABC transporter permease [Lachnospiraceae bacterium]
MADSAARKARRIRRIKEEIRDFTFVLPAIIIFTIIIVIPLISGIRFTFTDWNGMSKKINYVGFQNYIKVFSDKDLLKPIMNTAIFTTVTTVVINVLGLALAIMAVKEFRGVNVIKSIIFIPLVVSLVLVSYMWMYVYSDFFGILGWSSPLIKARTALIGICIMAIWKEVGLEMIIYLAALKGVSQDY